MRRCVLSLHTGTLIIFIDKWHNICYVLVGVGMNYKEYEYSISWYMQIQMSAK